MTITPDDITAAAERIAPYIRHTPIINLAAGELDVDFPLTLKLELLQHAGSFKPRGAFNAMLSGAVPATGAIAASGGNHGAAVAYAAKTLGHRAEIFVPTISSPAKQALLRELGADLNVVGKDFAEALETCLTRQAETGALMLHAYDQPEILAGQGTVAKEFEAQAPGLDTILVAVGGGGLIGGMAIWLQGRVKIVAVESEGTGTLNAARKAGEPTEISVSGVAADALGARTIGSLCFNQASPFIAESILVPDEAITAAQSLLWKRLRLMSEAGGATALAAITSGAYKPAPNERVGVLLCGSNASPSAPVFN